MSKNNFIIISVKDSSSLHKISVSNDFNETYSYSTNEIIVDIGKGIEVSFIDSDVVLIKFF